MSTKENNPSLLSKVAKFVRNPTTNWTDLDKQDPEPDTGYSKQALKEMIERKRQNDFVRKREFDQLRKLRNRDPSADNSDLAGRPSYFQSSLPTNSDERAMTIKKIDEIEAQMSNQWWQGKGDGARKPGAAAPAATTAAKARAQDAAADDMGYAPTRLSPMRPERALSGTETSDFPATQDNSGFGPNSTSSGTVGSSRPGELRGQNAAARAPRSGAGYGFSNSQAFAVELVDIATDPDLEEAAIRFANGDDAGAESGLLSALDNRDAARDKADRWACALLDLYRATGQQASFDMAAIEYAQRFGRSAPTWFSMPDMVGLGGSSAVVRTVPSRLMDEPIWHCPALLGSAAVDELHLAIASVEAPLFLDWTALSALEQDAVEPLARLFAEWCSTPLELRFLGPEVLEAALARCSPSGDRAVPQANWKLRLDALRVMRLQDEFDLVALDYCVTYEVSPPSWQDARCGYQREAAAGSGTPRDELHASQPDELPRQAPADFQLAATVPMGLEAVQASAAELSGEVLGEAADALARLEEARRGANQLVVSCAHLIRVDFSAAGSILNWVALRQAEGCQVQFREVHRLVAAFFNVIGINEHARILVRAN